MNEFKQFDVVSDDSDHCFLDWNNGNCFTDSNSGVYKAIMREWKILEQSLPESIYVRVYERRINLMRAVIVGAAGTPYHDGLFFFDIAFPSNYPNHPPKLRYHSFGFRINPNLYHNGAVCLSLLNTWHGQNTELWVPNGSTMLQVLVSIQGLVLNEKPYYNEPNIEVPSRFFHLKKSRGKSRAYNESTFTLTLKTSSSLLSMPPKNFEAFVEGHFRERGRMILDACDAYVSGRVRVGYYSCRLRSSWSREHVSREFKDTITGLYPRLLHQFRVNGAPLALNRALEQSENKNNASVIFKKVTEKIKKVLTWKKIGKKETESWMS